MWSDVPSNHAGSHVLKYVLELKPQMLWRHPPTTDAESEKKFFEVLDICGRWQVEQQRTLVVSTDGADPDLLQGRRTKLSAYGNVSSSLLGGENIFSVHRTNIEKAYVVEGGIGEIDDLHEDLREGAAGITFDKGVAADTAAALRRLHQNLGHPARKASAIGRSRQRDHQSCKGHVVLYLCPYKATEQRQAYLRTQTAGIWRCGWNRHDVCLRYYSGKKSKLFSIVDHASSYQVVNKGA